MKTKLLMTAVFLCFIYWLSVSFCYKLKLDEATHYYKISNVYYNARNKPKGDLYFIMGEDTKNQANRINSWLPSFCRHEGVN